MFNWVLLLLIVALILGCLAAMGAGVAAMAELSAALLLMICVSLLVALPFLE